MHFPVSGRTILKTDGRSIDAVSVKDGAAFIVLSTDAITVWHTESLSLLHSIRRVTASLESTGFNRRLFLRNDDLVVVVQTSGDVLLIYDLCEDPGHDARLLKTNESEGVPKIWLKHRQNIRVEAGALALCAASDRLVLSTKKPSMVQTLDWHTVNGKIITESTALSSLAFLEDPTSQSSPRVVEIVLCRVGSYLWIMNSGKVFLVKRSEAHWTGTLFHDVTEAAQHAVLAAYNSQLGLVTLTLANNQIISYTLRDWNADGNSGHITRISTVNSGAALGSPRSISWSGDGLSLLACCERGWYLSSPMGAVLAESEEIVDAAQGMDNGEVLRCAIWIHAGYGALFLPTHTDTLLISKFCISKGYTLQHATYVQYRSCSSSERFSQVGNDVLPWNTIGLPPKMHPVGPISFRSFSPCDRFLAIGTRYSFCLGSKEPLAWKVFSSAEDARSISLAVDPFWHQNLLVAATKNFKNDQQLRLYSRDSDLTEPLESVQVQGSVSTMVNKGEHVYVIYTDFRLERYQIVRRKDESLTLALRARSKLREDAPSQTPPIREAHILQHSGNVPAAHLLVLEGDVLRLIHPPSPTDMLSSDIVISTGVEWCQATDGIGPLRNAVFALCGSQIKFWYNLLSHTTPLHDHPPPSVIFDLDFCPLTVSLASGLIDGIEMSQSRMHGAVWWRMTDRSMSFLPNLLESLIRDDHFGEALVVTSRYAHVSYFPHVLEVLLSRALEDEIEHTSGLLTRTWMLLDNYQGLLAQIVVSCARKTELSYWDTLFSVAGDPKFYYQECIQKGDFKTAGSYLIVLHTLDEQLDHKEYTLDLCARVMKSGDWILAAELSRLYCNVVEDKDAAMKTLTALMPK